MSTPLERARIHARAFVLTLISHMQKKHGIHRGVWYASRIHAAMKELAPIAPPDVFIQVASEPGPIEFCFPAPGSGKEIEISYLGATARVVILDGTEPTAAVMVDVLEGGLWAISPEVRP